MSEICQIQQVLQLKYDKVEEVVEKLSTVNMSLREENSRLNCLLQVRVYIITCIIQSYKIITMQYSTNLCATVHVN